MTKWIAGLGYVTAAFVAGYWLTVAFGLFPVEELTPGYRDWFLSFPAADAWVGTWALCTAVALRRRSALAPGAALLTGSGLIFLGLYALAYGLRTGLIFRPTFDEAVEIAIKAYCLSGGALFVSWGLAQLKGRAGAQTV